ncbi:unnamed protein product [Paramecium sonneborni]|uniref:Uncharacterized protein n=1 Tax=Paramecium sonneborni TaxID=65129 RepID=A0A8S1REB4_9CILI|nr:unnamed protein product [Paramecium sonneborni]
MYYITDHKLIIRNQRRSLWKTNKSNREFYIKSIGIFLTQPILLESKVPIKLCGHKLFIQVVHIHDQCSNLLRLVQFTGFPKEAYYLFLRDRYKLSLFTICLQNLIF